MKTRGKEVRKNITLWAFKTVLVINAASNYRDIIPDDHFKHFYQYRMPPKDVKVHIGISQNDEGLKWVQSPINFKITSSEAAEQEPYLPEQSSY